MGVQVSDLLIRPTLTGSPISPFGKPLSEAKCRIVGFESSEIGMRISLTLYPLSLLSPRLRNRPQSPEWRSREDL